MQPFVCHVRLGFDLSGELFQKTYFMPPGLGSASVSYAILWYNALFLSSLVLIWLRLVYAFHGNKDTVIKSMVAS